MSARSDVFKTLHPSWMSRKRKKEEKARRRPESTMNSESFRVYLSSGVSTPDKSCTFILVQGLSRSLTSLLLSQFVTTLRSNYARHTAALTDVSKVSVAMCFASSRSFHSSYARGKKTNSWNSIVIPDYR
jgi:hypothetical protein